MKRKLLMVLKQSLTENDEKRSMQFLNKLHTGKTQIQIDEDIPEDLKEAHYRFHRSESAELEVELQPDGSSKPLSLVMNGVVYKITKVENDI